MHKSGKAVALRIRRFFRFGEYWYRSVTAFLFKNLKSSIFNIKDLCYNFLKMEMNGAVKWRSIRLELKQKKKYYLFAGKCFMSMDLKGLLIK